MINLLSMLDVKTTSETCSDKACLCPSVREILLLLTISMLRLVKEFLGGQTVTLGNSSSEIGRVSIVVVIGLSAQLEKDWWIKTAAPEKPAMTTQIQSSLTNRLLAAMWDKPWMVEVSRNSFTPTILVTD